MEVDVFRVGAMWVPNLPTVVISAVTATAGAICLFKDYWSGSPYDRNRRAENKVVIVTGANGGIGKEVVVEFANRGAKVFMACRDMKKCEQLRRDIVVESENKYVYCRPCDLSSLKSVADFVARFKQEEPNLHILVNNGGVMEVEKRLTQDGFEENLGVNHLSHFLLTTLLADTLKNSNDSRVIIVSCRAHASGTVNKEDLNSDTKFDGRQAYNQSKLANVLFGRELARQFLESNVAVTIVDPGFVDTNISRHLPMNKSWTRYVIYPLFWPFLKNARNGAQGILHAALEPAMGKVAGDYYVDMKKVEPSKEAQDYDLANWLWKVSEKWTKLNHYKAEINSRNPQLPQS